MQLNKTLQTFESSMNRKLNRVAADGEDLGKVPLGPVGGAQDLRCLRGTGSMDSCSAP